MRLEGYSSPSFLRRPSTIAPASPATVPRRAVVTDVVWPVFGSVSD